MHCKKKKQNVVKMTTTTTTTIISNNYCCGSNKQVQDVLELLTTKKGSLSHRMISTQHEELQNNLRKLLNNRIS